MPNKIMDRLAFHAASAFALVAMLLAGCSRSRQTADTAPEDIHGEPINAVPANPSVSPTEAAPADRVATPTPTNEISIADSAPTPSVAPSQQNPGFTPLTFENLASYEFVMPDETVTTNGIVSAATKVLEPFPTAIKALDQVRVALKGFMLPLKVDSGLVTELLIMRDQSMCCYGKVPKITEWVSVKMSAKGVKPVIDQPVTIYGKLHVGEMRENGYLVGIYRMDGEGMKDPE